MSYGTPSPYCTGFHDFATGGVPAELNHVGDFDVVAQQLTLTGNGHLSFGYELPAGIDSVLSLKLRGVAPGDYSLVLTVTGGETKQRAVYAIDTDQDISLTLDQRPPSDTGGLRTIGITLVARSPDATIRLDEILITDVVCDSYFAPPPLAWKFGIGWSSEASGLPSLHRSLLAMQLNLGAPVVNPTAQITDATTGERIPAMIRQSPLTTDRLKVLIQPIRPQTPREMTVLVTTEPPQ